MPPGGKCPYLSCQTTILLSFHEAATSNANTLTSSVLNTLDKTLTASTVPVSPNTLHDNTGTLQNTLLSIPPIGVDTNPGHIATTSNAEMLIASTSPLLKTLCDKVKNLPNTIPIANNLGTLAGFSGNPVALTNGVPDDKIWEVWDPQLNTLISQTISNIFPLVTCGDCGLIGLVQLFEHLVYA